MSVVALVPAAGKGVRLGVGLPKALVPVGGIPLLVRAVHGLLIAGCVDRIVVAAGGPEIPSVHRALAGVGNVRDEVTVVAGGDERTDSVRLALQVALAQVGDLDTVLVHDAARAFTPPEVIASVVAAVRAGAPAVVPVLPVTDTIKRVTDGGIVGATVDRTSLRVVQTPQGFTPGVLRAAHELKCPVTDDAGLVERMGIPVHTVPGHPHAMKITTPFDLAVAEAILTEQAQVMR